MKSTPYSAEILTIGNEIVTGLMTDTNSSFITRHLETLGIPVKRHVSVGDDEEEIVDALIQALERVDCVILAGGLGPTHDDITKQALCRLFDSGLVTDAEVKRRIDIIFQSRGRETPQAAYIQAEVPEKARFFTTPRERPPACCLRRTTNVFIPYRVFLWRPSICWKRILFRIWNCWEP